MNYYPKVLPSMQKWRGSTDPIAKRSRAKVRTAPGMVLDTVKPTFQSIVQNPPFKTKQEFSPSDEPRKTKLLAFLTRITIAITQINIWIFNVHSFPHRHDVMILNANYLGQCGNFNHALNGINCNVCIIMRCLISKES